MRYWIVEHPVRGLLVDYDYLDEKPKFKWSINRTSPEVWSFNSTIAAHKIIGRMKPSIASKCYLLEMEMVNGRVRRVER